MQRTPLSETLAARRYKQMQAAADWSSYFAWRPYKCEVWRAGERTGEFRTVWLERFEARYVAVNFSKGLNLMFYRGLPFARFLHFERRVVAKEVV